jgi:hypothetical protein
MFRRQNMSKKPVIKFVSTVPGLEMIEDLRPVPAKHFYPKWWKEIPFHDKEMNSYTAKSCPAFPDYFSQGFILPMWADTTLEYDPETTGYKWEVREGLPYKWDIHPNSQFIDHVPTASFQGANTQFVFKTECPWKIIAPKGYSILQLPLFYHFNNDFSVLPGIIRSDQYHTANHQVLVHGEGKRSIEIKRGTPFVQYIPIKREEFELDVHYATEKETYNFGAISLDISSSKLGRSRYRKMF